MNTANWRATKFCLYLFLFFSYSIGQSIGDSRCYLAGGGSAESLTASEDLSVGSVIGKYPIHFGCVFFTVVLCCNAMTYILFLYVFFFFSTLLLRWWCEHLCCTTGTLKINGNPRLDNSGNISLSIRERDAPVSLAPGTKNLVLNVALDREGKTGPSSVYVNVICVRRHTTDPVSLMAYKILCNKIML